MSVSSLSPISKYPHNEETTYESLPQEIRAMIWKYRMRMRKDAAMIIFRNFVRHKITCNLRDFLEDTLSEQESSLEFDRDYYDFDPDFVTAYADQYPDFGGPFADFSRLYGLIFYNYSFVTDCRNVFLEYSTMSYMYDEFSVDLTGDICTLRNKAKQLHFYTFNRAKLAADIFAKNSVG